MDLLTKLTNHHSDYSNDFDAAVVSITPSLLEKIRLCASLCKQHGLSETRFHADGADIQPFNADNWVKGRKLLAAADEAGEPALTIGDFRPPAKLRRDYTGEFIIETVVYEDSVYWSLLARENSDAWESEMIRLAELEQTYAEFNTDTA